MTGSLLRYGRPLALVALAAGAIILVIDWTRQLDTAGERIRESVVSDVGGALLVLTGLGLLAVLWRQERDARRYQAQGTRSDAVIEDVRIGFFGTEITLAFTDAAGRRHQVRRIATNPALRVGMTLPIRYDPANPRTIRFQETLDRLAPPK